MRAAWPNAVLRAAGVKFDQPFKGLTGPAQMKAMADRTAWLAEEVTKATRGIVEREYDTILRLSRAAEYRDPETGSHLARMARVFGR